MGGIHGRMAELTEIGRLIDTVQGGGSGTLVIRGEAGIGKSTLLDHAQESAIGLRVLRGSGVESEAELPFSALHLLFRTELDRIEALPGAQAAALRSALGQATQERPDRFLIGLAVLSLLAELADDAPLLCLIDDAQWLDRSSAAALLFASRRLGSDGVGMIFAARANGHRFDAPGLPEISLTGLDHAAATDLLAERGPELTPQSRDRIIDEAGGNPLALIELPWVLPPERRSGETMPPTFEVNVVCAAGRVQEAFRGKIRRLAEATRTVLLLIAADDTGEAAVILRAGAALGTSLADLAAAESADLIRFSPGYVRFRHPLIRAAVYQDGSLPQRLAAHKALAVVFAETGDTARRAWHLSASALGDDEEIAAELERIAQQAKAQAAHSAAATAYERAAQLTLPGEARGRRRAAAATSAAAAGDIERAASLADQAARQLRDPRELAALAPIRAAVALRRGSPRAAGQVLMAAASEVDDPAVAVPLLMEAARHAWFGGDRTVLAEAGARLEALPGTSARHVDWIRGLGVLMEQGIAVVPPRLLRVIRDPSASAADPPPIRLFVALGANMAGADEIAYEMADKVVAECRARGALDLLPQALQVTGQVQVFRGRFAEARALATEAKRIAHDTGQGHWNSMFIGVLHRVAATVGDDERCHELAAELYDPATQSPPVDAWLGASLGLLELGHGRYEAAFDRLDPVVKGPSRYGRSATFALPDHVEAAVRLGQLDPARGSAELFAVFADQCEQPWARAVAARCRALISPPREAEEHYAEAVRLHREGGRPLERSRSELLYGEWLRRERRRSDARRVLRLALEGFERFGVISWAERARTELRASGETITDHDGVSDVLAKLTPQELQVVRLAAAGLSNRDIGAQLFLSHRTVSYHLYKVFPKLGIGSRSELARFREPDGAAANLSPGKLEWGVLGDEDGAAGLGHAAGEGAAGADRQGHAGLEDQVVA